MPPSHTSQDSDGDSFDSLRFLCPNFEEVEDAEKYRLGGFHPVHLGDIYDDGRYRIVHKLGAGGFSTVWLARDEHNRSWVALKFVVAKHSPSISDKSHLSSQAASKLAQGPSFISEIGRFTFDGPNGHHLCLVLPVFGPSTSTLSTIFSCRLQPWLARKVGYQAAKAVADLHAQGICHGDITTGNFVLTLSDFDRFDEAGIYRLFGPPITQELETESGEPAGLEAPRYLVKALDFLSSELNLLSSNVMLIDFDQCFPISSPPKEMLGIPPEFLAPEVAVGLPASPASDVWALGCCLFRLRSGDGPFSGFEITSPGYLTRIVMQTLGDMPVKWQDTLWDYYGQPTKDRKKGKDLGKWEGERPLRDLVYKIWDQPEGNVVDTGVPGVQKRRYLSEDNEPFPSCFKDMVWKPTAVKVNNVYIYGFDDESDAMLDAMPKIPECEAALLYDLLSKIFVYDAKQRPTAREILDHPWFHMDD